MGSKVKAEKVVLRDDLKVSSLLPKPWWQSQNVMAGSWACAHRGACALQDWVLAVLSPGIHGECGWGDPAVSAPALGNKSRLCTVLWGSPQNILLAWCNKSPALAGLMALHHFPIHSLMLQWKPIWIHLTLQIKLFVRCCIRCFITVHLFWYCFPLWWACQLAIQFQ